MKTGLNRVAPVDPVNESEGEDIAERVAIPVVVTSRDGREHRRCHFKAGIPRNQILLPSLLAWKTERGGPPPSLRLFLLLSSLWGWPFARIPEGSLYIEQRSSSGRMRGNLQPIQSSVNATVFNYYYYYYYYYYFRPRIFLLWQETERYSKYSTFFMISIILFWNFIHFFFFIHIDETTNLWKMKVHGVAIAL